MATKAYTNFNTRVTPQSEPIPGSTQIENHAGGFAFGIDDWKRLDRFLVLGSDGGTYYVGERQLTRENASCVIRLLATDPRRVVDTIVGISDAGRAYKNDPALFALALASCPDFVKDEADRAYALSALPKVARIGPHLLHVLQFVDGLRGKGYALRKALSRWMNDKDGDALAFQALKYQSRDGWSMRDVLRVAHPKPVDDAHKALYAYIANSQMLEGAPALLGVYEAMKAAKSVQEVCGLIVAHNLTWEFVPSQWLGEKTVWEVLLPRLPFTALLRNLGRLTTLGLVGTFGKGEGTIVEKLNDREQMRKSRIHPFGVLMALKTYGQGHGFRGSLSWTPNSAVCEALDDLFYASFENAEPCRRRMLIGLDVSGSMDSPIMDSPVTCMEAAMAMGMIHLHNEPFTKLMGFDTGLRDFGITRKDTLASALRRLHRNVGGTDCSLPMIYAMGNKVPAGYKTSQAPTRSFYGSRPTYTYEHEMIPVDAFVVITDNETWAGNVHPVQALKEYQRISGLDAKLVVIGMQSTDISIADPTDGGSLDVVGMDTSVPSVVADFCRG
jgi:60 kDa SS-A/Ro ribonucleoprotein